jgi:hypothetical protein
MTVAMAMMERVTPRTDAALGSASVCASPAVTVDCVSIDAYPRSALQAQGPGYDHFWVYWT